MWKGIPFLDKDLMADSTTCREEIDAVSPREGLDVRVFGEILVGFVLDVMVQGKNKLRRILDFNGAN